MCFLVVFEGLSTEAAVAQAQRDSSQATSDVAVDDSPLQIGDLAPDFELKGIEGKTTKLSDFRRSESKEGKNVLVTFVRAHW